MNRGGKKGIIITIIIILCILLLAVGGFLVYATTDLFHSNQTLFFKYIGQVLENFEYVENTQMAEIENLKESMPYQVTGKLTYEPSEENTDNNSRILSNMELNITSNVSKPEEKAYTNATLRHENTDLFTLEYAHNNNIYALKSNEIVTAFLGVENDNLKVLMQKLGVTDNSIIPNTIEGVNINKLLSITEEEKQHIKDTYITALIQNINSDSFSKDANLTISKEGTIYNTTAYRLTLSAEELKTIKIALLQTLQQDSITLNLIATKAKALGLDENYTQVNNLNGQIQKQINQVSEQNSLSNEGVSIAVYVDNGKVITTEMIVDNEVKYTIYGDTQENSTKRHIYIENLSTDMKIIYEQTETTNSNSTINNITLNFNDYIIAELNIENIGSAQEQQLQTNIELILNESTIRYEQEITFQDEIDNIVELTNKNCAVLNNYTTEQLLPLLESIGERIATVFEEKKQAIGWRDDIQDILENVQQEAQEYEQERQNEQEALNSMLNQVGGMMNGQV